MMRMSLATMLLALIALGCADNKQKTEPAPADTSGQIPPNVQPTEDPYARNPPATAVPSQPMGDNMAGANTADEPIQPISETGKGHSKRTHIVKKGETLTQISRQYYGNPDGWKKIYEANKSRIASPDKLTVGMKLIIP